MANNVQAEAVVSAGTRFVMAEVTAYGDANSFIPGCFLAIVSGAEGSQTFAEVLGGAGAVAAGVQRVTLASDDPAVVALQILDNAIAGNEMQVDIVSGSVSITGTVTVGSHAVTNAGTFAVQVDGNALTALQLIDDVVYVDDADWTALTSKHVLMGGIYQSTPGSITDGDTGPFRVDINGHLIVNTHAQASGNALADDLANSINAPVDAAGALTYSPVMPFMFDGTAWDRLRGTSADGLLVNLGTNNDVTVTSISAGDNNIGNVDIVTVPADPFGVNADAASATGSISAKLRFIAATGIPITGTVTVGSHAVTNAGTFLVQENGTHVQVDDAAFTPATSKVMMAGFEADETATDSVDEGDGGAARMTLDRKQIVTIQPHTAGGLSIFRSLDLDETEEEVKATAGCVYGMWVTNTATTTRFVKFYNATAANVTVGSTTPVITIGIPGNTSDDISGLFSTGNGIGFDTAITVACTTAAADADTGTPSAGDLIINLFFK